MPRSLAKYWLMSMVEAPFTVGVLGGMGPEATIDFQYRVLRATPAQDDADHVRLLIDNNPAVPSRIEFVIHGRGASPGPTLAAMAQGLESLGADCLVMPCNTAHLFVAQIRDATAIEFISMIDATVAAVGKVAQVGLLASTAVIQTDLYSRALSAAGVNAVVPDDDGQQEVMALIRRTKAGKAVAADSHLLQRIAADLVARGAECLVVACTELSVLSADLPTGVPVVDAAQVLAEETVARALRSKAHE